MNNKEIEAYIMPLIHRIWELEKAADKEIAEHLDLLNPSDELKKSPAELELDSFVNNLLNKVEEVVPDQAKDFNLYHYTAVLIINRSNLNNRDEVALPFYQKGMKLWEIDNTVSLEDKARMCRDIAITYQYLINGNEGITFNDYFSMLTKAVDYSEAAYGSDSDEFSKAIYNVTFSLKIVKNPSEKSKEKLFSWSQKCKGELAYLVNLEAAEFISGPDSTDANLKEVSMALECLHTGEKQLEMMKDRLKPIYNDKIRFSQNYNELKDSFKRLDIINKARLNVLSGNTEEDDDTPGCCQDGIDGHEKAYDVFVSYARKDFNLVTRYVKQFEDEGLNVWMDKDGIKSGDQFKKEIVSAIKNSKVFVFFSSKAAGISEWTEKEIGIAIAYHVPIIPAKLDDSVYNDSVALDLVNLDFVELFPNNVAQTATSKLIQSLKKKCGIKSIPLIDKCKEHIKNHDDSFGFIFRNTPFIIYIQPLNVFVLDFCKSTDSEQELINNLVKLLKTDSGIINNSLRRYEPTFGDLLTQSGPRFVLYIDGYAVKVCNLSGFKKESIILTQKLDSLCSEYHLSRKECTDVIEGLIENPSLLKNKTQAQKELEENINYYRNKLIAAFNNKAYPILFKPNQKFPINQEKVSYIGFSDMYANRYCIREGEYKNYHDSDDKIIASYGSAEELLRDGWQLD